VYYAVLMGKEARKCSRYILKEKCMFQPLYGRDVNKKHTQYTIYTFQKMVLE
jgi:hypothetical protein